MARKIILSSPTNTPDEEKIFVIEESAVKRSKVRLKDVEQEIFDIDDEIKHKNARKVELEGVKAEIDKLLKK